MGKKKRIAIFLFGLVALGALFFWRYRAPGGATYSAGVTPHHLLAEQMIRDVFASVALCPKPEIIVLVGPDHFNQSAVFGNKLITAGAGAEEIEKVPIISDLLRQKLPSADFYPSTGAIKKDHAIIDLLPFVAEYLPGVNVLPILVPARFEQERMRAVAEYLNEKLPGNSMVLASVDFSHYKTKAEAELEDAESIPTLLEFKEDNFRNIAVDCRQCLYLARYFAELRGAENSLALDHKNSQDFSAEAVTSTTSYFTALFYKDKPECVEN